MSTKQRTKHVEYNPPHTSHGYTVRWVENASRGLRLVGFADEVARREHSRAIEHKGWFIDDEGTGDVYRGVVYQLPSRGAPQYVYGYADPCNGDCALLCFDVETTLLDAARAADRFAEIFAEEARDYDRASQASARCEDLAAEIKEARKRALAIGQEMRAAKRQNIIAPTICASMRREIASLYRGIQKARKEIASLVSAYGKQPGFEEAQS